MEEAGRDLARTGSTSHPLLKAFILARHINLQSGGAVISPWDLLDGYDLEDWAGAAITLSEVPSMAARQKSIDSVFEKVRKGNKDYNVLAKRRVH